MTTEATATTGPIRRCLLSGARLPKEALLRLVEAPDGSLVADLDGTLPGRGVWVRLDKAALAAAVANSRLAKQAAHGLRSSGVPRVPGDLAERIDALMTKRCLALIGLERRAGRLAVGFEKVRAMLRTGSAALIIVAADAGADAEAKVASPASRQGVALARMFGRAELGLALGRENVVHAAVERGGATRRLIEAIGRLARYRGLSGFDGERRKALERNE